VKPYFKTRRTDRLAVIYMSINYGAQYLLLSWGELLVAHGIPFFPLFLALERFEC